VPDYTELLKFATANAMPLCAFHKSQSLKSTIPGNCGFKNQKYMAGRMVFTIGRNLEDFKVAYYKFQKRN
jgi:hypothetical protein